jgi:hypothetical protein
VAEASKKILAHSFEGVRLQIQEDYDFDEERGNGPDFGYTIAFIDVSPPNETHFNRLLYKCKEYGLIIGSKVRILKLNFVGYIKLKNADCRLS